MRYASIFGMSVVVALALVVGLSPAQGTRPGVLIVAGEKEYRMLAEYPKLKGKFRAYDAEKSTIAVRVEYKHATKEMEHEYKRFQEEYRSEIKHLETRNENLVREQKQSYTIGNKQERSRRQAELHQVISVQ